MDSAIKALSKNSKIAVTFVDVTESVKVLERRHLSGPAASLVLGQGIAAVALMASNIDGKGEKVSMQLLTEESVQGGVFEASATGELRGYTNIKILNNLDGNENLKIEDVLNSEGKFCVIQSSESKVISNSVYTLNPASVRAALARYYNETLQRPTAAEIYAGIKDGYIDKVVAIIAEKMPDGESDKFIPVLEAFDNKEVYNFLAEEYDWEKLKNVLRLDDLEITGVSEFKFTCECSRDKVLKMLSSLDKIELQEVADKGEGQEVICHFCGEGYNIADAEIKGML